MSKQTKEWRRWADKDFEDGKILIQACDLIESLESRLAAETNRLQEFGDELVKCGEREMKYLIKIKAAEAVCEAADYALRHMDTACLVSPWLSWSTARGKESGE